MDLMRYSSSVSDVLLSALILLTSEVYIWLGAAKARWTIIVPIALLLMLWRRQAQTAASLGLPMKAFGRCWRQWTALWISSGALFLFLGRDVLFHGNILLRGELYFVWCVVQQLLYQSVVWTVARKFAGRWAAALVSGVIFALLHVPNPVLVFGTLIWGMGSSLLFENCRTVFGLALLQVMVSSMLLWITPYQVNRGFRTGPSYYTDSMNGAGLAVHVVHQ